MIMMPLRLGLLGWKTRRYARKIWPIALTAAVVATLGSFFLVRTDTGRIAEQVNEPYAIIEIVPESLQENWVTQGEGNRGLWVLAYATRVIEKQINCDEILIKRRLERLGDPRPVAENSIPTKPVVPLTNAPLIATGQALILPSMLTPADYVFLLEVTCFQRNSATGVLGPVAPAAQAPPLCFRVPGIDPMRPRAPIAMLPMRCQGQLSTLSPKVSSAASLRGGAR